jgi:hypothetical protein
VTSSIDEHGHSDLHGHSHFHGHSDSHGADGHTHDRKPENNYLGPSNDGSVMLDIGGDIGALVLITPQSLLGTEIEVSPADQDAVRTHVAIRERRGPGGTRYAGIYPSLVAGTYTVWDLDGNAADTVTIVGGQVAQLDWS